MADVRELIDRGIKHYLAGRVSDALGCFQQVLELDPGNTKARSYLVLIHGGAPTTPTPAPRGSPRPAPPAAAVPLPGSAAPGAVPLPGSAAPGAVPLPGSAGPGAVPLPGSATAGAVPLPGSATAGAVPLPAKAVRPAVIVPPPPPGVAARTNGSAAPVAPSSGRAPEHEPADDFAPSPWDEGPAAGATFVLDSGGGLDLQAVSEKADLRSLVPEMPAPSLPKAPVQSDVEVWMEAARELFALGDFSGSLELIEKILQVDPDHGEARDYLRQNEATLIAMYESKLGPLAGVPRLAIKPEEVMWLNLDHRAGFLLAQIDGTVDYESLFALSGLPRLDTARILANLIADGVIAG